VKAVETAELAELVHGDCRNRREAILWCAWKGGYTVRLGAKVDWRCTVGVMELVFDRLARAACLWRLRACPTLADPVMYTNPKNCLGRERVVDKVRRS
jgi:hypothetical protein